MICFLDIQKMYTCKLFKFLREKNTSRLFIKNVCKNIDFGRHKNKERELHILKYFGK